MKVMSTNLRGCILIGVVYKDERGYFLETFKNSYLKILILNMTLFKITNPILKNILRGLYFQKNNPQGKLVRVSRGTVFDVVAIYEKLRNIW